MNNATTVLANVHAVSALLASAESWHSIDFWASVFCFIGGIVSAAGGVGGGGLYVPVLILLGGLSSQAAVPVSTAIIFGNAFASLAFNAEMRHPTADRPLIDLQVVLLLEPPTLTGAALGVLLNRVLPASVTFVLLIFILGLTTVRTTMRGCRLLNQRKADAHLERAWSRYRSTGASGSPMLRFHASAPGDESSPEEEDEDDNAAAAECRSLLRPPARANGRSLAAQRPPEGRGWNDLRSRKATDEPAGTVEPELAPKQHTDEPRSMALLVGTSLLVSNRKGRVQHGMHRLQPMMHMATGTWLFVSLLSLLRGSRRGPSPLLQAVGYAHLTLPCTFGWWVLLALTAVLPLGVTRVAAARLLARHRAQVASGYVHMPGEPIWTPRAVVLYPSACVLAGVAAGLLGIGGGMIKGPLLLEMGLVPQAAAATSAFMIFFTSSSTTLQFLLLGALPADYAVLYGVLGFAAALLGGLAVRYAMRRNGGSAFIVFAIAIVLGVSTVLMMWVGVRDHLHVFGDHAPRSLASPPPPAQELSPSLHSSLDSLCMF